MRISDWSSDLCSSDLPETLSTSQLTKPWRELPRSIDFSECGTFVPRGSELWSFVPLPILTRLLGPIVDLEASVSVAREEVEASPDAQRRSEEPRLNSSH